MRPASVRTATICIVLVGFSCGSPKPANNPTEHSLLSQKALAIAQAMIGKPYKFMGETPSGFDCSGLVRYSYRAAGMNVPHGTVELVDLTHHIPDWQMSKGDLVFFDRNGKRYGHVGIYAGNNRFVHAPSRGKTVRIDSLLDPYWKEHFIDARRF